MSEFNLTEVFLIEFYFNLDRAELFILRMQIVEGFIGPGLQLKHQ